jgi:hypothetical protein
MWEYRHPAAATPCTSSRCRNDCDGRLRCFQRPTLLPSIREILIVSHREPHLTLHQREERGWVTIEARTGATVALAGVAGRLSVDDVYRDELEDTRR